MHTVHGVAAIPTLSEGTISLVGLDSPNVEHPALGSWDA
jgi:hypothetical protein